MTSFNLLHYPALASQRRKVHRRWTSLAGLLVGAGVAVGLVQMAQKSTEHLQNERVALQKQWVAQDTHWQSIKKQQDAQKTWQLQSVHLKKLHDQHLTWLALHQSLQQVASPDSVQLVRLQLETGKLELQGHAANLANVELARMRLTQKLSQFSPKLPPRLPPKSAINKGVPDHALQPFWVLSSLLTIPTNGAAVSAQPPQQIVTHVTKLTFVWQSSWPVWSEDAAPAMAVRSAVSNDQGAP